MGHEGTFTLFHPGDDETIGSVLVSYSSDTYFAGLTSGFSGLCEVPAQAGVWIEKVKDGEPPKPVLAGIARPARRAVKSRSRRNEKPAEGRRALIWRSANTT
jgi:hypothetical protein